MKSSLLRDILACNSLKVNRCFEEIYCLHLQTVSCRLYTGFLLDFLQSWRWRRYFPAKRRLTISGLHGVISQKAELFLTTVGRTSNPTCSVDVHSAGHTTQSWLTHGLWAVSCSSRWQAKCHSVCPMFQKCCRIRSPGDWSSLTLQSSTSCHQLS
jgi:hypothetical protein